MTLYRKWLLILGALILGGGEVMAAPSREERAYLAAEAYFQTATWGKAETAFAEFVQRYPKSTNAPMAVLLQAQAEYNEGKFKDAAGLLTVRKAQADGLADQYALWIGESEYAMKEFPAAAGTFTLLVNDFGDSPLRLRAAVAAAAAYKELQEWDELTAWLEATNGVFARQAGLDSANELVSRGRLLLAQAKFTQQDYAGASALLQLLNPQALKPELDWQRAYLLCQTKMAEGELDAALTAAGTLSQIAQLEKDARQRAESVVLRAEILERMGRPADAMTAYQENLATNVPDEKQREAILNIATLAAALTNYAGAAQSLEDFLDKFPDSAEADIALLAAGELQLKEQVQSGATNGLLAAQAKFDQLLAKYPDSALAGKALLDRGWCQWLAGKAADSLADFQAAATRDLTPSDYAVAKFKAGDALFAQKDFQAARASYRAVFPEAQAGDLAGRTPEERDLAGPALYQELRACLELNDLAGASDAFTKVFQMFSDGELGQGSALLYGESLAQPDAARELFLQVAAKFSGRPLEPELRLAIARTYEQQQDWPAAVTNYEAWVRDFPTNSLRAQADYALAQATYLAGDEAGALQRFTKFVTQHPADAVLAPQAQWWVAEHYFRAGEFIGAETNYEAVFQTPAWKTNALVYHAQLMAGRAAMGRASYKEAMPYFTGLFGDTNCLDEPLKVQARFAYGTALMLMSPGDTNASPSLQLATNQFYQIVQLNPTNDIGMRAWGELGDSDQQLGDFAGATNAYAQVFSTNSPADISARSRAQAGYGMVLEKMADQARAQGDGDGYTNLCNDALQSYLGVYDTWTGDNLREGEKADAFWVQYAGKRAAPLVGMLEGPKAQRLFYQTLKTNLPPLADAIDKKIATLPAEKD